MRIGSRWVRVWLLAVMGWAIPIQAQEELDGWPRELDVEGGTLVIYQPQPESIEGNVLTGRAAAQFDPDAGDPIFGTLWFTSRVDTDADAGTALVRDVEVTRARWPDVTDAQEERVTEYLTGLYDQIEIPISYERLSASLAVEEEAQTNLVEGLNNEPPEIIFRDELSVLLLYDGEPRALDIPDTNLEHIANAPFAVIRDKSSGTVYLSGGKIWYSAPDPLGPFAPIDSPPSAIRDIVPPDTSSVPAPSPPPAVVVATSATELVVTDGAPEWAPIGNGDLLYITNTESPVVRDVNAGMAYMLVSGRWYRSSSLEGPWEFIRPDRLPETFSAIPADSDLGGVRVSVAGTEEAENAVLDAQIPQTAAIDRSTTIEVTYDGDPQWVHIDGTEVAYAVNTGSQVLRIGGHYYAADQGVWFESDSPNGPWRVADNVPSAEIAEIPPDEPVYNLTSLHVYDSSPEVVHVGYTPGYMWSYPYFGVPFYGTGWYYRPWWGPRFYYPRFPTWGFHVGYNPWTGWSMGFSWSVGFMSVGFRFGGGYGGYRRPGWGGPRYGGFYPPGGYRRPVVINTGDINIGNRTNNVNIGNRVNVGDRNVNIGSGNRNIYNNSGNRDRKATAAQIDRSREGNNRIRADQVSRDKANNVLSDRDGNVFRQDGNGNWQSRESREWRDTRPAGNAQRPTTRPESRPQIPQTRPQTPQTRPSTRPATRPAPSSVQRDQGNRSRGSARAGQVRTGGGRRR
jgi:hypothetical protein